MPLTKSKEEREKEIVEKYKDVFEKYELKGFLDEHDPTDIEAFIAYFLSHGVPFVRYYKKNEIQKFDYEGLLSLEKDEERISKEGDADYVLEKAGEWSQIGGEKRQEALVTALKNGAKVKIVLDEKPLRKSEDARKIAKVLIDIGVEVKYKDDTFRIIVYKKKNKTEICCFKSGSHTAEYGQPHDPDLSYYEGFGLVFDDTDAGKKCQPFLAKIHKYLQQIYDESKPAADLLRELEAKIPNNGHKPDNPAEKPAEPTVTST